MSRYFMVSNVMNIVIERLLISSTEQDKAYWEYLQIFFFFKILKKCGIQSSFHITKSTYLKNLKKTQHFFTRKMSKKLHILNTAT